MVLDIASTQACILGLTTTGEGEGRKEEGGEEGGEEGKGKEFSRGETTTGNNETAANAD